MNIHEESQLISCSLKSWAVAWQTFTSGVCFQVAERMGGNIVTLWWKMGGIVAFWYQSELLKEL